MKDIVLYCKSYDRDVLRAKRLVDSIERYNADKLSVYLSVPDTDRALFENKIGKQRCEWVTDEDIVSANPRASVERMYRTPGNLGQQVVKSEFWRLGIAENYVCLDSDSQFIRDFHHHEFMAPDGNPYTVFHQSKELLQLAVNRNKHKMADEYRGESERGKAQFARKGLDYDYGPPPMIWSAKVWRDLDEKKLAPDGMNLWDAIDRFPAEIRWYGEALLAYGSIPLHPVEPLFRFYHYDWEYFALKRMGETEEKLKRNYMGVVYQSNWEYELDYGTNDKSALSRFARRVRRQLARFR